MALKTLPVDVVTPQLSEHLRVERKRRRRRYCSAVFRICRQCLTKRIHPNDTLYSTGVCLGCTAAPPGCLSSGPRPSRPRPAGKGRTTPGEGTGRG